MGNHMSTVLELERGARSLWRFYGWEDRAGSAIRTPWALQRSPAPLLRLGAQHSHGQMAVLDTFMRQPQQVRRPPPRQGFQPP
jgi:hypothetical protein